MRVTTENPTLNSPFRESTRHFRLDEDGVIADIVDARRLSTYFVPISQPSGHAQLSLNNDRRLGGSAFLAFRDPSGAAKLIPAHRRSCAGTVA